MGGWVVDGLGRVEVKMRRDLRVEKEPPSSLPPLILK